MKIYLRPFVPLLKYSLCVVFITFVFRFGLSVQHIARIRDADQLLLILTNGLRIDLSFLAMTLFVPLILILVAFWLPGLQKFTNRVVQFWLVGWVVFVIFLEVSTPLFISEFDIRPNRLFIEYLNSPLEISSMLSGGFLPESILIVVVTISLGYGAIRLIGKIPTSTGVSFQSKILVTILLAAIFILEVLVGRSGLQHRPINPAMVAVSGDRLVNSLTLNSAYSVLYSAYALTHESDSKFGYGRFSKEKMMSLIKSNMDEDITYVDGYIETLHYPHHATLKLTAQKDLIIVVEESLGASFVESLGGKPVTPNIEKWRQKSWFFDRLYATGIRSARGLEAITTGFLPTRSRAVLKLPRAQDKFFTLANYLGQSGYESTFIYGGESHFDNMKGFFLSNGFNRVIDQYDYENPSFLGSWGVSDEDLFDRALAYIEDDHEKPQFILIFSSSNHPPFEYPDGKIDLYENNKATALNAVKYADFALGEFLDALENNGALKKSTVLVIADHEDKVFGSNPVPYERYHIPGFILDPDVADFSVDTRLVSQIDMAPTLISLLGINSANPMIGHDLTNRAEKFHGRAIMQFGENQAYMTDECIVYLQPDKAPMITCNSDETLSQSNLVDTAIAHAQFAESSYREQIYSSHVSN